MKNLLLIPLIVLIAPSVNAAGESCNSLLNLGLYNVNQSSSASDAQSLARSTFCSADYSKIEESSSQAASIKGSYGIASGGASASASRNEIITKQIEICKGDFNSSHYSANASDYSKTVYQGSLDAWNKCQELANKGLVFGIQPSSTLQGVSVSIIAPTGLSAIFYGVTQYGTGQSSCTTMANNKVLNVSTSKPFKFTAASKVTVNCTRQMNVNGQDLTADAQDLVFVTSADNLTVPLAAIGNFSRMTADQIKADANTDTQSLINQVKTDYQNAISQALVSPTNSINSLVSRVNSSEINIGYLKAGSDYILGANSRCPLGYIDLGYIGLIMEDVSYKNNPFLAGGLHLAGWHWAHPKLCHRNF